MTHVNARATAALGLAAALTLTGAKCATKPGGTVQVGNGPAVRISPGDDMGAKIREAIRKHNEQVNPQPGLQKIFRKIRGQ